MLHTKSTRLLLPGVIAVLLPIAALSQKHVDSSSQIAFVYFKNRQTNLIVIPNIDKLSSFKFYRKAIGDTAFVLVAEKKKFPLPLRNNVSPYGVYWEDKDYHTKDVEYRIIAFNKKGNEICKLNVIWEDAYNKK